MIFKIFLPVDIQKWRTRRPVADARLVADAACRWFTILIKVKLSQCQLSQNEKVEIAFLVNLVAADKLQK